MSSGPPVAEIPAAHVPRKAYLVGLDSLRAIAALSVCLFHYTNGALPKVIVPAVKESFSQGYLGVEIFFVISGFIIPYSLLGKSYTIRKFFSYMKKRIIRINPPAYVAMLLVVAQWVFIDKFIQHNTAYMQSVTMAQVLHNMLFTVPFTSYKWFIGVFWTLAIEFEFYLFVGVLFVWMFESRHIGWFLAAYLVAQLIPILVALPSDNFLHYSSLFALGGVALLWQQQRLSVVAYVACLALFTGLLYWQMGGYVAAVGLGTALAVTALQVQIPLLGLLGKISYSFYLLHVLIGTTCEFVLVHFISPTTVVNKLLIVFLCLVAAILGSYLFYTVVEKPMMRLAARQR